MNVDIVHFVARRSCSMRFKEECYIPMSSRSSRKRYIVSIRQAVCGSDSIHSDESSGVRRVRHDADNKRSTLFVCTSESKRYFERIESHSKLRCNHKIMAFVEIRIIGSEHQTAFHHFGVYFRRKSSFVRQYLSPATRQIAVGHHGRGKVCCPRKRRYILANGTERYWLNTPLARIGRATLSPHPETILGIGSKSRNGNAIGSNGSRCKCIGICRRVIGVDILPSISRSLVFERYIGCIVFDIRHFEIGSGHTGRSRRYLYVVDPIVVVVRLYSFRLVSAAESDIAVYSAVVGNAGKKHLLRRHSLVRMVVERGDCNKRRCIVGVRHVAYLELFTLLIVFSIEFKFQLKSTQWYTHRGENYKLRLPMGKRHCFRRYSGVCILCHHRRELRYTATDNPCPAVGNRFHRCILEILRHSRYGSTKSFMQKQSAKHTLFGRAANGFHSKSILCTCFEPGDSSFGCSGNVRRECSPSGLGGFAVLYCPFRFGAACRPSYLYRIVCGIDSPNRRRRGAVGV